MSAVMPNPVSGTATQSAVALFFVRLLFSSLLEDCMVESSNTSVYPTHSQSFGKTAVLTIPV